MTAEDLFQKYSAGTGVFDEMQAGSAEPRPHWASFIDALRRMGRTELTSRWENGQRLIREHGVTYNVYGDPQGMDRPWRLDLVPFLIASEDWARLEAGLIQRSRLLNLILTDVYGGTQRLLRDGFIPPDLVYANPGFFRPCRGIAVPKSVYLHLHACDLARSGDGKWWVVSDRTQAPSGAGYALENRTVISRVLPEQARTQRVQSPAHFFRLEREMLFGLAPHANENPSVVLLTPGPHNETFFEQAYLARYLGFPLVEGADLTVRDRRVFLKTLDGLQPVDVILRRVDDSFCDPLELRQESFLGVPGLIEATRAGNVALANAIGSGLLENPAFLAFLPGLCRHLLSEELLLPSVATWWCGQAEEQRYVIEHLEALVVKPAFGRPARQSWFGGRLSRAERTRLVAAIRSRPRDFVGQERVVLSRAPVWTDAGFEARPIVLRAYVANGGESLAVLPGGLTRVARTAQDPIVSLQSGGGSKDTWVLGDGRPTGKRATAMVIPARRPGQVIAGVPSRAADNLFWLGRYVERLEQTLRILRCVMSRLAEEAARDHSKELRALGGLLAHLELLPAERKPELDATEVQRHILELLYAPELPGGVRELLGRIRLISSAVRDRFSGETWRILGRLETEARARRGRLPVAAARTMMHDLVFDLAAFSGMEMENMTRGDGWRFLDAGRRIERALAIVQLLRAAILVGERSSTVLEPVLEIADSVMTYRRRNFAEAHLPGVLQLLLCDESNPRSLAFQMEVLRQHAAEFPRDPQIPANDPRQEEIRAVADRLLGAGLPEISSPRGALLEWLENMAARLGAFSDDVSQRYFSHTTLRIS